MTLPMESDACQTCHASTFADWENSSHGDANVDCFDCHKAHDQGLRIEPQEKLCSACHTKEETQLAHNVHGISGINCVSCHMAPMTAKAADGSTKSASSHQFTVASNICAGCHSGEVHGEASAKAAQKSIQAEDAAKNAAEQGKRIGELEAQVNADQQQIKNLRNIGVVAMGLTLGVGGAMGLIVGVAAATLVSRRKQQ
jgi:formate-dependent nitrite reductase cytochrome c552 subunit